MKAILKILKVLLKLIAPLLILDAKNGYFGDLSDMLSGLLGGGDDGEDASEPAAG